MRILNICHVFPPEHAPAGVNAAEAAEDWAAMGHEVTVITGWPNHPEGVLYTGWRRRWRSVAAVPEGYQLIRCWHAIHPRTGIFWRLWYYFTFALWSFVAGLGCKSPHVIVCESTPIFGPLTALLLARIKKAKLVYRVHDVHPEAAHHAGMLRAGLCYQLLRGLDTWVCKRAALVLTLTEGMRSCLLRRGLQADKVLISRHWVDGQKIQPRDRDNAWRRRHGIPLDSFVALHAGTIGHISGAQLIIEAADLLRGRPDLLFLFVGDGPLKTPCEQLARDKGLTNVRFLPFQPAADLCEVQATGDVGVVTLLTKSGDSSIPSKMHGYTAAGRPVVASVAASSATAEIIKAGDLGIVVTPEDPAALAAAIASLADAPEQAARFGQNARRSFETLFERKAQVRRLDKLLRECVDPPPEELTAADTPAGAPAGWQVVPFASRHLAEAVAVHLRAFPGFFLTSLGPRFLQEFYGSFLEDPWGLALVAEDGKGRVLGVVAGPVRPEGYFRRLLRRRWWAFGWASLSAVLRTPSIAGRLLRAVLYRGDPPPGPSRALLSSIAVAPEAQGRGVGSALVREWLARAQTRGCSGCYLTTDADRNETVNRFYRELGWTLENCCQTPEGRALNRYVLDFAPPATTISKVAA